MSNLSKDFEDFFTSLDSEKSLMKRIEGENPGATARFIKGTVEIACRRLQTEFEKYNRHLLWLLHDESALLRVSVGDEIEYLYEIKVENGSVLISKDVHSDKGAVAQESTLGIGAAKIEQVSVDVLVLDFFNSYKEFVGTDPISPIKRRISLVP